MESAAKPVVVLSGVTVIAEGSNPAADSACTKSAPLASPFDAMRRVLTESKYARLSAAVPLGCNVGGALLGVALTLGSGEALGPLAGVSELPKRLQALRATTTAASPSPRPPPAGGYSAATLFCPRVCNHKYRTIRPVGAIR